VTMGSARPASIRTTAAAFAHSWSGSKVAFKRRSVYRNLSSDPLTRAATRRLGPFLRLAARFPVTGRGHAEREKDSRYARREGMTVRGAPASTAQPPTSAREGKDASGRRTRYFARSIVEDLTIVLLAKPPWRHPEEDHQHQRGPTQLNV